MRVQLCGEHAVLVDVDTPAEVTALTRSLQAAKLPHVVDIVPAARTVLVMVDPASGDPISLIPRIKNLDVQAITEGEKPTVVEIPVNYQGMDFSHVCRLNDLTSSELIFLHTHTVWEAAFGGFAPGFMYLQANSTPDDFLWDTPRLDSPRSAIPAGSVGLAGPFSAVYPQQSPGGWQLIGHTSLTMWDVQRPQPSLITPGNIIKFVQVNA
ncbi:allophanate hydrolase subunit 1 [Corynebacterium felinum]|uniref:KipI family sensor histidine kinase inhibitor n=1 Tax=Corynebacterium felinum TaxID=131318 RepID=A0ABU2B907_9CORY|nr:allophanate hydrolase subunit 1 [Corynebacterium felinum]MDF5820119.1 allophanate hydrolase subunit 1 [Corynebacterium felinum]MDR7353869.1 KipI family sensor histidine kinase inhibitor [Corynebacterium felinum]WJY96043.1 Kinase A inhibitor [Corynebacterium felinum]